jgi:hypothetical protein
MLFNILQKNFPQSKLSFFDDAMRLSFEDSTVEALACRVA